MSEIFLCDTNFWITCANELYPFSHFPSYWTALDTLLTNQTILLHWSVVEELKSKDDQIKEWVVQRINAATIHVIPKPTNMPPSYIKVCMWPSVCKRPQAGPYKQNAIDEFCDENRADAWLCAQALESNYTLVTRESAQPRITNKVKIPDVCKGMNIKCVNFNGFFDAVSLKV